MNNQYLMTGLVLDTNDPDTLGRVLIRLPALPEGPELWARLVSPLAGNDRGLCFLPEIGDEVLVAFTQGDLSSAYVLGGLWGKQKPPPEGLGGDDNDLKILKTRSGHTLTLNDKDGEEKITLTDKNGNRFEIATKDDLITVTAKSKIEILTDGDIVIEGKTISLKADSVEIKTDSSLTLDGGSKTDVKGGTVNIN